MQAVKCYPAKVEDGSRHTWGTHVTISKAEVLPKLLDLANKQTYSPLPFMYAQAGKRLQAEEVDPVMISEADMLRK